MKNLLLFLFIFVASSVVLVFVYQINPNEAEVQGQIPQEVLNNIKQETPNYSPLDEIDKYQSEYFSIIKRNNILVNFESDENDSKVDRADLENLYKTVENKVNPDNEYYKRLSVFETDDTECKAETTADMNNCVINKYGFVDGLLNEVYQVVQEKISQEDFEKLKLSEQKWLKEVEDYRSVFDTQEYGTMETVVYYGYQIDMKKFRALLLMTLL